MRNLYHRNISILFEVINDIDDDSVVLVTEYMAGGCVMEYDSSLKSYIYSISSANILQGYGKFTNLSNVPSLGFESNIHRKMTENEVISLFCDLLKVIFIFLSFFFNQNNFNLLIYIYFRD